jgi:hypothetical protein
MPLIKFHKNSVRVNSLALATSVSSHTRGAKSSDLAKRYMALLTRSVNPTQDDVARVQTYLSRRSLVRKYTKNSGARTAEDVAERLMDGRLSLEMQDWYLSDPSLGSQAGSERDATVEKTIDLCGEMGFLRSQGGTRQNWGRILVEVAESKHVLPFDGLGCGPNPYSQNISINIIVFYLMLRLDLEFVKALLDMNDASRFKSFYSDIGPHSESLIGSVITSIPRTMANRRLFVWLEKQSSYAKRLREITAKKSAANDASIQSAYRPIEDLMIPRVEYLVDFGLLEKSSPTDYSYRISESGQKMREAINSGAWNHETDFVSTYLNSGGVSVDHIDDENILDFVTDSYVALRNPAGYAPIEEVTLRANAMAIGTNRHVVVDVARAKQRLMDLAKEPGTKLRIVSDRHRRASAFRIVE